MKSENGQATVELALSMTVLTLFLFGIVEFGRIFTSYIDLKQSGREAARAASLGATDSEIRQAAVNASALDPSKLTVTVSPAHSLRKRGSYVTVGQTYPVHINAPLLSGVIPNPVVLKNKYVMRME